MTNHGPVTLITGATSGLGLHLAQHLGAQGVTLLVHGRDHERVHQLCRQLEKRGSTAQPYVADLADLAAVRALGQRILAEQPRLDVLVNNAGVGPGPLGAPREISRDGHELRFAVGYLAPYLLTRLLLPALRNSAAARVVNVGSAAQMEIEFDDLSMADQYDGWIAYGRAKLALASFSMDLAAESAPDGIGVACVHPADLMPTPLVHETGLAPQSTIEQGVEAVMRLVSAPSTEFVSGGYYHGLSCATPHTDVLDAGKRKALREATAHVLASSVRLHPTDK